MVLSVVALASICVFVVRRTRAIEERKSCLIMVGGFHGPTLSSSLAAADGVQRKRWEGDGVRVLVVTGSKCFEQFVC